MTTTREQASLIRLPYAAAPRRYCEPDFRYRLSSDDVSKHMLLRVFVEEVRAFDRGGDSPVQPPHAVRQPPAGGEAHPARLRYRYTPDI